MDKMTTPGTHNRYAIWAVTAGGAQIGKQLAGQLTGAVLHLSERLEPAADRQFTRLAQAVTEEFHRFDGHIFIMATGIVVRIIAPLLRNKTRDPAVVVMDEKGRHAISLLSGHLGGANRLAIIVSEILGADPVITTATDVNNLPAIDILAKDAGLSIENPEMIKEINAAILNREPIRLHDPFDFAGQRFQDNGSIEWVPWTDAQNTVSRVAGVFIDDRRSHVGKYTLMLRPPTLAAGMGCNRGTDMAEMKTLLMETLEKHDLSVLSLTTVASVDIKHDEAGLIDLAKTLGLPLTLYGREQLKSVKNIENPSDMVDKHIGVKSVCEAAAILAARRGRLIVPKKNTANVTVAIARVASIS